MGMGMGMLSREGGCGEQEGGRCSHICGGIGVSEKKKKKKKKKKKRRRRKQKKQKQKKQDGWKSAVVELQDRISHASHNIPTRSSSRR